MKTILKIVSYTGLALTIFPSILVFKGVFKLEDHFLFMIIGMVLWFITAPFWIKGQKLEEEE